MLRATAIALLVTLTLAAFWRGLNWFFFRADMGTEIVPSRPGAMIVPSG